MNQEHYAPPGSEVELVAQVGGSSGPFLHSLSAVVIAAFFGGAFAAGYLVYRNFVQLGQRHRANRALAWFAVGGTVALYVAWHTPPDFISFMLSVGFPQLTAVLLTSWLLQGNAIAAHRLAGGRMRSNWFALAIGVAASLATKALFYGLSHTLA